MNDESRYNVTFSGEIVSGVTTKKVIKNLALLFKSPESTIEKLFLGKVITIKKAITEQKALTYQQAMYKAGALAKVELVERIETIDLAPAPKTDEEIAESHRPAALIDEELPPPPAFAENSVNDINVQPSTTENDEEQFVDPPAAAVTNAADPLGIAPAEQWRMEAVGTRMSKPKRAFHKPLPNTDYIKLSPEKSDMGQAKHKIVIVNPDTSYLDIAAAGSLLSEPSNADQPKVPDVSHIDIAAVGEDMGQIVENKEIINPDISQYHLADTGSDMGQLKKEKDLLDPDISHLDLADD